MKKKKKNRGGEIEFRLINLNQNKFICARVIVRFWLGSLKKKKKKITEQEVKKQDW